MLLPALAAWVARWRVHEVASSALAQLTGGELSTFTAAGPFTSGSVMVSDASIDTPYLQPRPYQGRSDGPRR